MMKKNLRKFLTKIKESKKPTLHSSHHKNCLSTEKQSTNLISNLFPPKECMHLLLQQEHNSQAQLDSSSYSGQQSGKATVKKCKEKYLEKGNNR